jgi:hypothetical protein
VDAPQLTANENPLGQEPVVSVIQEGARLHYALPVALRRRGILGTIGSCGLAHARKTSPV